MSKDYDVNVVMTRVKDVAVGNASSLRDDLQNRLNMVSANNADIFVSLHVDADANPVTQKTGFGIFIPKNNSDNYSTSKVLASAITEELKNVYTTDEQLKARDRGILILDRNSIPAIIVFMRSTSTTKRILRSSAIQKTRKK